jgi:hypothetical protein
MRIAGMVLAIVTWASVGAAFASVLDRFRNPRYARR